MRHTTEKIPVLYKRYSLAEGSQHIASEYAIKKLWGIVLRFGVENVLEVGLGIGSISGILLELSEQNEEFSYSGTEANEFCLNALESNLEKNYKRLKVYPSLQDVKDKHKFDLVIIDGKDADLEKVRTLITRHGIIAIEGDRMQQQDILKKVFPRHKMIHAISITKNKDYSPFPNTHWQGGLKVIFVNPDGLQKMWWIKEKLSTKVKHWIRRFRK